MVTDQFGMIGLLTFIRAAETDPNLVSLALGADLTTLGLNLNSEVNLYPTFGGPWAETPCRPQDIDYHVPHEYLTNQAIRWESLNCRHILVISIVNLHLFIPFLPETSWHLSNWIAIKTTFCFTCSIRMLETFFSWQLPQSCTVGTGVFTEKIGCGSREPLGWHPQNRRQHMKEEPISFLM